MTDYASAFLPMLDNANSGSLERGRAVAHRGMVKFSDISEDAVRARVQGTDLYRVSLTAGRNRSWLCNCPAAADGSFCKHCVAVVVALEARESGKGSAPKSKDGPTDTERIEAHVRSLNADALAEIVLEQASHDEQLSYRLLAAATAQSGEKLDLREWKKRVTASFRGPGGFIEWRKAPEWARGVHDMLDILEALLGAGHATEVAALAEHAHRRAESAVNRVDDSGGEITAIFHVIREVHLGAAQAGAYPPKKLGKRLAELELSASLDTWHRSAIDYADALGPDGLDAYLAVVNKAHAKLAPNAVRWGPAFAIEQARIAHAIATVDPDRLIEIFDDKEDMTPSDYVEVVELFITASRIDEAEDWAGRGLHELAGHRALGPLRDLQAHLLRGRTGSGAQIEKLYWKEFLRRPAAMTTRELLLNCEDTALGRNKILTRLEGAIDELRAELAVNEVEPFAPPSTSDSPPGSVGAPQRFMKAGFRSPFVSAAIIEVLVELGEVEQAWALALEFGAAPSRWSDLVERRVEDHPADAVEWALVAAEIAIDQKSRAHYRRAVRHLQGVRALAADHDGSANGPLSQRVNAGADAISKRHSNKPALLEELAKGGWPRNHS